VAISCPESEKKLVRPTLATPAVSQRGFVDAARLVPSVSRAMGYVRLRSFSFPAEQKESSRLRPGQELSDPTAV